MVRAVPRNPMSRGLCLDAGLCPSYTKLPSALAHVFLSLRSSHLVGDHEFAYGVSGACPKECHLCRARVYSGAEEFGAAHAVEHRWRHIEHLLLLCPCVASPLPPGRTAEAALRHDLLRATAPDAAVRAVVELAFPAGMPDAAAAAVYSLPFLLDPVRCL